MKKFFLFLGLFIHQLPAFSGTHNDGTRRSTYGSVGEIAARLQMEPSIRLIRLPGNLHLEYMECGDPAGQPVIFLHGYTDSRHSFDRLVTNLAPGIHAYVLTMRGHGNSDKPGTGYMPGQLAADVVSFMDELRIDAAAFVGHSLGASVAQRFAIDYPERTKGLVLIGTIVSYEMNDVLSDFENEVSELSGPVTHDFAYTFQKSTLAQGIPASWFDTLVNESRKVPIHVWKQAWKGLMNVDYTAELRRYLKPVLLIRGKKDLLATSSDQEKLLAVLSSSSLVTYRDAGHAPHWEEPVRVSRDISHFLLEKL